MLCYPKVKLNNNYNSVVLAQTDTDQSVANYVGMMAIDIEGHAFVI